jgi:PKD repeat protein
VFGPNGQPLVGVDIYFAIAADTVLTPGPGLFADIGTLTSNRAISGGNGIAQVIYRAPPRTDATGNQTIVVSARPVGNDANGQLYRTVRLELRSAEPKLFPPDPFNNPPTCQFTWEAPDGFFAGRALLFQDTSFDEDPGGTIIRYIWDFGDGARDDKPDVVHIYGSPGPYEVRHRVTDNRGADDDCTPFAFTIDP